MISVVYKRHFVRSNKIFWMTVGVCRLTKLIVNIVFKALIIPIISKKIYQSLFSDADRLTAFLPSSVYPRVGIFQSGH